MPFTHGADKSDVSEDSRHVKGFGAPLPLHNKAVTPANPALSQFDNRHQQALKATVPTLPHFLTNTLISIQPMSSRSKICACSQSGPRTFIRLPTLHSSCSAGKVLYVKLLANHHPTRPDNILHTLLWTTRMDPLCPLDCPLPTTSNKAPTEVFMPTFNSFSTSTTNLHRELQTPWTCV